MSLMLPTDLAWVLNLLGFNWPNVDEDQLRTAAADHRRLAAQVEQAKADGTSGAGVVTGANTGRSVQAFASKWGSVSASHLGRLQTVYELTADAQDLMAEVVAGAKGAVIAQLIALAAEITTAVAASVVTFGLSDAAGLAATALTKVTVQEILNELERQVVSLAEQLIACEAMNALSASVGNLLAQGAADYVGSGHGLSLGAAATAGTASATQTAHWLTSGQGAGQAASAAGAGTVTGLAGGE